MKPPKPASPGEGFLSTCPVTLCLVARGQIFPQVIRHSASWLFCFVTKPASAHAVLGRSGAGARRPPQGPGLSVPSPPKECRWRELEEHRQAERLQRQLQQEQAYLLSLQHDPRRPPPPPDRSKAGLHEPKAQHEPADRAREVRRPSSCALPRGWWVVRGREGPLLCLVLSREDPSASLPVPSHLNTDLDGRQEVVWQHPSVPVHGGRVACSAVFPELPSG